MSDQSDTKFQHFSRELDWSSVGLNLNFEKAMLFGLSGHNFYTGQNTLNATYFLQ